jgi:uncharacterized protein
MRSFLPLRERRVFVDSAAYLALLDATDAHHSEATEVAALLAGARYRQFTTNAVAFEAHALILSELGIAVASDFLRAIDESNTVFIRVRASDEARAKQIVFAHRDKDYSFTDALSFVVMERLGIRLAFTFDRHFTQFGFLAVSAGTVV